MANGDVYTNAGKVKVIALMNAASWYVQSGTGTGTPAATDTALGTATGSAVAGTDTVVTTTVANDTLQVVGTCAYTSSLSITEAGVFDASGGSGTANMIQRHVFTAIPVTDGDSIEFTFKHKQA